MAVPCWRKLLLSGLGGGSYGAEVVASGGLGERLWRGSPGGVNLETEHPLRPLHAELVYAARIHRCHCRRVLDQLSPHPGDLSVQGDLAVRALAELVAPPALGQPLQLAPQPAP